MPKSVAVTVTLILSVEVPSSWKEEKLSEGIAEALEYDVKSSNKKVVVEDVQVEDLDVEDEED